MEDPVAHCLEGKSLLLSGMHREDAPGEADRDAALGARRGGRDCPVQNLGLGAQTADRWVRLLPGLAGRGGGHAARRRAVGRHR